MELNRCGLVILAAGEGSRFSGSTHKLLAPLDGRPVVGHSIAAAVGSAAGPVAVVTGAVDLGPAVPAGVQVLHNPDWSRGQASSLAVARHWAQEQGFEAFVVGLGDQPFVGAACWAAVAERREPLVTATFDGRWRPPVRLGREVWELLPDAGDLGARDVLRSRPEDVIEIPCEGNAADIDTVEDLERWT